MGVYISDNPLSYLHPPTVGAPGDFANQLRAKAGFIFGTADAIVQQVAHFSPLKEWVTKPFAGDWDSMGRAAGSWRSSGDAIDATRRSVDALPNQVGDDWNGDAYEQWALLQQKLTDALAPLPDACRHMAEFADALADMARGIAEYIAEVLGMLGETIARIIMEQAFPIVGQFLGAAEGAVLAVRTAIFGKKICDAIDRFYKMVQKVKSIVENIQKVLEALATIAAALSAAVTATNAANAARAPGQRSSEPVYATAGGGGGGGSW